MSIKAFNRRKVWLINPRFQIRYLIQTVGVSLVAISIFYGANAFFFWKFRKMGRNIGLSANNLFFQFLDQQEHTMLVIFAVTAAIAFVALIIAGLLFSHRISGPLYRLRVHMLDVAAGKTQKDVNFRDKDFFPELADAFNKQLQYFRSSTQMGDAQKKSS